MLKGFKYPSDGPLMTQGEVFKHQKYFQEFIRARVDMAYTNQVLTRLSDNDLVDAIRWIKLVHIRNGNGFKLDNSYQKVPRDACRVSTLAICSMINKELCEGKRDPDSILTKIRAVHEGQKMLELHDLHRGQAI
jgi:hypothetical protein